MRLTSWRTASEVGYRYNQPLWPLATYCWVDDNNNLVRLSFRDDKLLAWKYFQ